MKTLMIGLFVLSALFPVLPLAAKTCMATLGGVQKHEKIPLSPPSVFYPDHPTISRPANWMDKDPVFTTKNFLPPEPVLIECGSPLLVAKFGPYKGNGYLPPGILTYPWMKMTPGGFVEVPMLAIPGEGTTDEFPFPMAFLDGEVPMEIIADAPAGVSDVCDVTRIDLPLPLEIQTVLKGNIDVPYEYSRIDDDGHYYLDRDKSPFKMKYLTVLEGPHVNIMCKAAWELFIFMNWDYYIPKDHPSMCGSGQLTRNWALRGKLVSLGDNKVEGNLDVEVPELSGQFGTLSGYFTGKPETIHVEGRIYSDEAGKSWVELQFPPFGDGGSWNYTMNCPYGKFPYSYPNPVKEYWKIYESVEDRDLLNPTYLRFPAEGGEKEFEIDKGGQQTVIFFREFTKLKIEE